MTRLKGAVAAALVLAAAAAFGQNIRLSQIDSSHLLLTQTVRLYVSVTDAEGRPVEALSPDSFRVSQSADGVRFDPAPVTEFRPAAAGAEGINFLLLIDNSGSMYDTIAGRPTTDPTQMRITAAKEAVRAFLSGMTHPADTVGLVAYNTLYATLAQPQRDKSRVSSVVDTIARPATDQAYTELYASLARAAGDFNTFGGRKAIVVLSDGENFPFAQHAGRPNPELGTRIYAPEDAIRACQEEGVSIYAINFGAEKDRNLQRIAVESGGAIFDAGNREELQGIYRRIHTQVSGEYLLGYRAGMAPAEKTFVRVSLGGAGGPVAATRFYFSSTVFGLPMARWSPLLLLALIAAAALYWVLSRLKFERKRGPATLEVLTTRVGRAQTRVLPITTTKTVIGGATANLTIAGNPEIKEEHATILLDPKKGSYTIVGGGDITVNNQSVRKRVLEPGDVINVAGATIVFDEGDEKKEGKKKK